MPTINLRALRSDHTQYTLHMRSLGTTLRLRVLRWCGALLHFGGSSTCLCASQQRQPVHRWRPSWPWHTACARSCDLTRACACNLARLHVVSVRIEVYARICGSRRRVCMSSIELRDMRTLCTWIRDMRIYERMIHSSGGTSSQHNFIAQIRSGRGGLCI